MEVHGVFREIFYAKNVHLVVATEVRCRSVMSNEVETLLKSRFRPWPGLRRKNAELTALTAMTNSLSRNGVRKQVARNRATRCNTTVRRSASVWRRERKAVYIYARHHVHVLGVTMKQQVAGAPPRSTSPLLPNFYDRLCNLDGPCNPPFQPFANWPLYGGDRE